MTINGIHGTNTQMGQMGMNQAADSYSRNILEQIANAQKQLQELSLNEDMPLEEKMKKRQEIQQQISDLKVQLRQHQMEQRREKQQVKGASMDDRLGGTRDAEKKGTGLSQASMTAMISADNSIKQAKIQGSAATSMEGRTGVLKSEIKYSHGRSVEGKQEQLADIEQKAQAATSSQLSALADASKAMEEAAKTDSKKEKTDDRTEKADSKGANTQAADIIAAPQPAAYRSVDIRL